MSNETKQTAVELMIAEIQRRVAIIQSEPQTMARELMIENLGVDLDIYKEMEKEQRSIELPSDEEIWDKADEELSGVRHYAFMRGAKWMRNKIQGGEQ